MSINGLLHMFYGDSKSVHDFAMTVIKDIRCFRGRIQRSEFVNSYQQQPVCCLVFFFSLF